MTWVCSDSCAVALSCVLTTHVCCNTFCRDLEWLLLHCSVGMSENKKVASRPLIFKLLLKAPVWAEFLIESPHTIYADLCARDFLSNQRTTSDFGKCSLSPHFDYNENKLSRLMIHQGHRLCKLLLLWVMNRVWWVHVTRGLVSIALGVLQCEGGGGDHYGLYPPSHAPAHRVHYIPSPPI